MEGRHVSEVEKKAIALICEHGSQSKAAKCARFEWVAENDKTTGRGNSRADFYRAVEKEITGEDR